MKKFEARIFPSVRIEKNGGKVRELKRKKKRKNEQSMRKLNEIDKENENPGIELY